MACGKTLNPGDAERMEKSRAGPQHPRPLNEEGARRILEKVGIDEYLHLAGRESEQIIDGLSPIPPTKAERLATSRAARELGIPKDRLQVAPPLSGVPGKEALQACLRFVGDARVPRTFIDAISHIQFVPHQLMDRTGHHIHAWTDPASKTVYIPLAHDGGPPRSHALFGDLAHELVHVNWSRISQKIQAHKSEFDSAMMKQWSSKGPPSAYFAREPRHGEDGKIERLHSEKSDRVAELYRCYLVDESRLHSDVVGFFDKHFSPNAWGEVS